MGDDYVHSEMEKSFQKIFYQMADKVDNFFENYEKIMTIEKNPKEEDNASVNQEGGGKNPTPPSSP